MRSIISISLTLFVVSFAYAQTPIDDLQKQNLTFLEQQEGEGYEFRSQIITEFDQANASQNVNINLSKDFTYIIVGLGDSNIPDINLAIKPAKGADLEDFGLVGTLAGKSFLLKPIKSGKFKITIEASGLSGNQKGFISFMVLRK